MWNKFGGRVRQPFRSPFNGSCTLTDYVRPRLSPYWNPYPWKLRILVSVVCASHTIRRHATPRHATHELLSRFSSFAPTKRYKKIRDDRLGARFTRLRVYTPPIFLLSRAKFYGNLARNRIPSREELDDAVRARPSNFPTSIGRTNYANSVT